LKVHSVYPIEAGSVQVYEPYGAFDRLGWLLSPDSVVEVAAMTPMKAPKTPVDCPEVALDAAICVE
jgi:hypothetical protein